MKTVRFRDWDCIVEKRHYANGRPALQLVNASDGSPVATATVNMPDHPAGPNHVFIKDYSENEGMLAALIEAGVVRDMSMRIMSGFVEVPICELQDPTANRRTSKRSLNPQAATGRKKTPAAQGSSFYPVPCSPICGPEPHRERYAHAET